MVMILLVEMPLVHVLLLVIRDLKLLFVNQSLLVISVSMICTDRVELKV